jgi:SAM-dependent methyltransferase
LNSTRMLLDEVKRLRIYSRARNLEVYFNALFQDVQLDGATVLDVGGGAGVAALYAKTRGARKVVCLEPELDGSRTESASRFHHLAKHVNANAAEFVPLPMSDIECPEPFDVVLLHNTINHLDEHACITLRTDANSKRTYREHLRSLVRLTRTGGAAIVADVSPQNMFARLGVTNPFARTIEWEKHQPPDVWIELLNGLGFGAPIVRWTPLDTLGRAGLLFTSRRAAFLHRSHFAITMRLLEGSAN